MRVILILLLLFLLHQSSQDQAAFSKERNKMVDEQLVGRGIHNNSLLNAMRRVPRHQFVPQNQRLYAYQDRPLPIGNGQTISQPYMVAYMTQVLNPKKSDRILEIGTGSGYQAAVLAELVDSVYTIEIVKPLGEASRLRLKKLGYQNILSRIGDGYSGWPEKAPFNSIIVTAGAEEIPLPLVEQLEEGGRMVIPVGPHQGVRDLILITKHKGKIKKKKLMKVVFVPFTRERE